MKTSKIFLIFFGVLFLVSATNLAKYFTKVESDVRYANKDSVTVYLAAKLDTTNIINASWYSDAEVDALLDSVRRIIPFVITINNGAISAPADATTYYSGFPNDFIPDANGGYHKVPIPTSCKLVGFASSMRSDVASTAETFSVYVRKNNTADYALASNFVTNVQYLPITNKAYNLNSDYTDTDYIEIKIVTPTWVTNPTNLYSRFDLYFIKN